MAVQRIVVTALVTLAALLCAGALSMGALEAQARVPQGTAAAPVSEFGGPAAVAHPETPKAIWREPSGRSELTLRRVPCSGSRTADACFAAGAGR
jgi:hypothetical protein